MILITAPHRGRSHHHNTLASYTTATPWQVTPPQQPDKSHHHNTLASHTTASHTTTTHWQLQRTWHCRLVKEELRVCCCWCEIVTMWHVWCVGPGQREMVDQTVVQRAGVQVSSGRGGGGGVRLWLCDMCGGVGPGQREMVDQTVVQRAGVQVSAGRGGGGRGGSKVGISQRPRIAPPPVRAAPAAPRQAARPAANPPRMISELVVLVYYILLLLLWQCSLAGQCWVSVSVCCCKSHHHNTLVVVTGQCHARWVQLIISPVVTCNTELWLLSCFYSLLTCEQKSPVFPSTFIRQEAVVATRRCSENGKTDQQHEKPDITGIHEDSRCRSVWVCRCVIWWISKDVGELCSKETMWCQR